ncbi:MAG TPA: hypothetical protein DIC23_21570 [Planctomycetaceae bacterium]|jgi:hypothetical protein|nr:hypothetical protein [Planctomycetaceae bacterium]HCK55812.1 hypothetical protein [Planctomycetaceae bacterium]|tara:strand:- start:707 stop:1189 length:483 start_codon:yes stop_codon:yes gene_type:complete
MSDPTEARGAIVTRHLVIGWWSLLIFVALGLVLESMHGFKVAWYVNSGEPETTRLMMRLAHAHGTFLSLVHLAFAWTVSQATGFQGRSRSVASRSIQAAGILVPAGFLLAGLPGFVKTGGLRLGVLGGDPGLGIVLVPIGALLLILALYLVARGASTTPE